MKLHQRLMALTAIGCITSFAAPSLANESTHTHDHQAHEETAISEEGLALLQPRDIDVVLGDADAPILIVEYASLSCPHCASFHKDVFPSLKEKWIDTGKVRFIFRNYPLNAPAFFGAKLTRCGESEAFHDRVKLLLDNQSSWALAGKDTMDKLQKYASLTGIDKDAFTECMGDKAMEEQILAHMKEVKKTLKLRSTPTLYINGKELRGAPTVEMLDNTLEFALIEAKANNPETEESAPAVEDAPAEAPSDNAAPDAEAAE